MSEAESNAEEMVEEGLKLYSQGKLDEALAKWHAILDLIPDHPRATEYIKYVEDNRAALEESFRACADGEDRGGAAEPAAALVTVPYEDGATEEGEAREETAPQSDDDEEGEAPAVAKGGAAGSPSEVVVAELPPTDLTSPKLEEPIETTARMDVDELKARIQATKVRLAGRERGEHRTPSSLLPAVDPDGDSVSSRLELVKGGGEEEGETGFEPFEKTPIGTRMPKPARPVATELSHPEAGTPAAAELSSTQPALGAADDEERVASMLSGASQLFEQETYEGSLWLCERILSMVPDHAEAKELLEKNQGVLQKQYEEAIGDPDQVPVVQIPQHEILWHKLDHRAGFLLSRIDGQLSFQDVIDVSGMSQFDASRILAQLQSMGVIGSRK